MSKELVICFWLGDTLLEQATDKQTESLVRKALESVGQANG